VKYFSDVKAPKDVDPTACISAPSLTDLLKECSSLNSGSDIFPLAKTALIVRMRPVKDMRDISVSFAMPRSRDMYRKKPFSFIGYLLSNKAAHGLHTQLLDRGLISTMTAGISSDFEDFSMVNLHPKT
jgi:secreted Zn-dependent insulinase-like peptidase